MRTTLNLLFISLLTSSILIAQENKPIEADSVIKELQAVKNDVALIKNLKISGWIQTQFQYVETRGAANYDGGNFSVNSDKRFMIRRGRIKFTYNAKNSQYVIQLNGTERGLNLTEIYGTVTEPWSKSFSFVGGVMNRPFGFEIDQSSVVRESPERSRYTQILMPNERDMGAKIVYAPTKKSKLFGLRLDAGFYNGQGVYVPGTTTPAGYAAGSTPVLGVNEFDFQKDFIGRLSYHKSLKNDKIKFGLGTSHYNGGNIYSNNRSYNEIVTNASGFKDWKAADTNNTKFKNKTAPRIYYGVEAFFSFTSKLGTTTLRGEYVTGTQSGYSSTSASPFFLPIPSATSPNTADVYVRSFNGMYAYFIQRIAKTKHEISVKYEWYDPNTKVKGNDIAGSTSNALSSADIKYTQLGFTYLYYFDANVKFMANYNIITNESTKLAGYTKDLKDNVLTLRVQYRF